MKEKLDKYIADNMEKETKCYKEISLKDLLETSFYANEKGELVGEFTLTRINQIADILTYLNEDVRTGKEINYELEQKYERMKENAKILSKGCDELQERIDKAIRTLETLKGSARWERHLYEVDYLLNILTGGDEE